jgi:glycosyltransferase involved in cell wall biosynthesis
MNKKLISLVAPCFNEEDGILDFFNEVHKIIKVIPKYDFEILFIDNASTDETLEKLKSLASKYKFVKIIVNTRNFGHIRSPYWGIIQSRGDATIYLASDLQDPPNLIPQFIQAWESGYMVVFGVKSESRESPIMFFFRKFYYHVLDKISDTNIIHNATGFGLYDKKILDKVRKIYDPNPFFRGLIAELGYEIKQIPFIQNVRKKGASKNNLYKLFDFAMLGIVSHTVLPIRLASFIGFSLGFVCLLFSCIFTFIKIFNWDSFSMGIAPIVVGMFFLFGLIFIFIGLLGEYIASIHSYVRRRPVVVEKERINFDDF